MTEPILQTRELFKFYGSADGRFAVVRDVSLAVPRGRFVTVMGPSGSGKSTLLHMVSGLEPPSGGTVQLAGHDLYSLSEKRRTLLRRDLVGFVFQFYNLIPNLTVEQNIRLPLMIGAGPRPEAQHAAAPGGATAAGSGAAAATPAATPAVGARRAAAAVGASPAPASGFMASPHDAAPAPDDVRRLVDFFHLEAKLRQYPHQLSGGEMQRVSIARALVSRPAIIMADEPTGNISSAAGEEVMRLFRRSCDEFGQTILLVTHNARDAGFSDEVHFLKDGELRSEACLRGGEVSAERITAALARLGI
ncbi:MAG TPA: ABC transporter ATP-binding protein [Planctomycetota bacterium]|nr:ABC transporter ATP-binding protein [Planctomycetota bacterium]